MKGDLQLSSYIVLFIVSIVLSSLFLTSCSHQKYPSEWAALVPIEENKCPDIRGSYVIASEVIDKPPRPLYESERQPAYYGAIPVEKKEDKIQPLHLYEVFPRKDTLFKGVFKWDLTYATYVQISQPDDDTLEVSFLNDNGLIDKRIYSVMKKEYACSPKGISFSFSQGFSHGGIATGGMVGPVPVIVIVTSWGKYYLAKSIDGCLIIEE